MIIIHISKGVDVSRRVIETFGADLYPRRGLLTSNGLTEAKAAIPKSEFNPGPPHGFRVSLRNGRHILEGIPEDPLRIEVIMHGGDLPIQIRVGWAIDISMVTL